MAIVVLQSFWAQFQFRHLSRYVCILFLSALTPAERTIKQHSIITAIILATLGKNFQFFVSKKLNEKNYLKKYGRLLQAWRDTRPRTRHLNTHLK